MITSALTARTALREPQPPMPPTGHESPQDARDGGWLGQVPPADPPATPRCSTPVLDDTPPMTGHESVHDAREAGWLGQVPPPAPTPRCPPPAPSLDEVPIGNETEQELRDAGWLGQVPPPPPSRPPAEEPEAPTYANPQLAPDPWHADETLYPSDPTLFG